MDRENKIQIFKEIVKRTPNYIYLSTLKNSFPEISEVEIKECAELLSSEKKIQIDTQKNTYIPDRVITRYKASEQYNDLCNDSIEIGNTKFPRIFVGDPSDPERINEFAEALAQYHKSQELLYEQKITALTEELKQKYWANVAVLFGMFLSVFAIIIKSTDTTIDLTSKSLLDSFWSVLIPILPLILVLTIFIIALWFVLGKKK